jgi:hypothetical protein
MFDNLPGLKVRLLFPNPVSALQDGAHRTKRV